MIVPEVFLCKIYKMEFKGLIFGLDLIYVWAFLYKKPTNQPK